MRAALWGMLVRVASSIALNAGDKVGPGVGKDALALGKWGARNVVHKTKTKATLSGMIHYLDFEGGYNDSVGTGGVTGPSASCITYVTGVDGSHTAIRLPGGCQLKLHANAHTTEYTVSFFFKSDTDITPGSERIDLLYGYPHNMQCYTCWHLTANKDNVPDLKFYWSSVKMLSPTFAKNTWYHVLFTQTATSQRFYVDGALVSDVSGSPTANAAGTNIYIGTTSGSGSLALTYDDLIWLNRGVTTNDVAGIAAFSTQSTHIGGDPHLRNLAGKAFDVTSVGNVTLVRVPRQATGGEAEVWATAKLTRFDSRVRPRFCGPAYITELAISGTGVGGAPLVVTAGRFGTPALTQDHRSKIVAVKHPKYNRNVVEIHMDGLVFKVGQRQHQSNPYLNVDVRGLSHWGPDAGGLLGWDDHRPFTRVDPVCQRKQELKLSARNLT